jgi:hypothetical protein
MNNRARFALTLSLLLLAACGGNTADAKSPSGNSESTSSSLPSGAVPASDSDLGDLETKRLVDSIKSDIPKHKATFKEKCGYDIAIDVDWASFGRSKVALEDLYSNLGIETLVDVVAKNCSDKAGKDAVKAKIKTIKAVNVKDTSQVKFTLAGGTFTTALAFGGPSPKWGKDKNGSNNNSDDAAEFIKKSI